MLVIFIVRTEILAGSCQQHGWTLLDTVNKSSAPDDGRKHRPKHVELTWNNKLNYIVHLVGYFHSYTLLHMELSPWGWNQGFSKHAEDIRNWKINVNLENFSFCLFVLYNAFCWFFLIRYPHGSLETSVEIDFWKT